MLVNHYLRVLLDLNTPLVARLSLDNEDGIKLRLRSRLESGFAILEVEDYQECIRMEQDEVVSKVKLQLIRVMNALPSHLGDKDVETSQSKEKASTKRNKKGFDNMGWPIGVIPKSIFGHKSSGPPPFSGQKGKELNETEDVEQSHHVDSRRTMGHSHFDKDGGVSRKLKPRLEGLEGGDGERSNWFDVRLASSLEKRAIQTLVSKEDSNVLFLMETKFDGRWVNLIWQSLGFVDASMVGASNTVGSLCLCWKVALIFKFYLMIYLESLFYFITSSMARDWSGSFVYNLPMRYEMADFWENLALEITGIDSP
uniref:Uncharacterized protein n=1 Tax=Cannabis sativa TaxID=3483 RepID=A0A803NNX2_CANSA